MDELGEITDFIQDSAGQTAEIIKGYGVDETLGGKVKVTLIATGFTGKKTDVGVEITAKKPERIIHSLLDEPQNTFKAVEPEVTAKVEEPIITPSPVAETPVAPRIVHLLEDVVEEKQPELSVVEPVAEVTPIESNEPVLITKTEEPLTEIKNIEEEKQVTFEFEVVNNVVAVEETLTEEVVSELPPVVELNSEVTNVVSEATVNPVAETQADEQAIAQQIQEEEQLKKAKERIMKLKELNFKLKSSNNSIADLENEPAYKRRSVELNDVPHSSESNVSKYTLGETEDNKIEIRPNNSFLHDNVD